LSVIRLPSSAERNQAAATVKSSVQNSFGILATG
jgi:hypothetical protein